MQLPIDYILIIIILCFSMLLNKFTTSIQFHVLQTLKSGGGWRCQF